MMLYLSKKMVLGVVFAVALASFTGCSKSDDEAIIQPDQQVKIAVISDIHVMAPSLLVNDGTAFQTYLAEDRKMLVQSEAILKEAVTEIIAEKPNICLVTGDLTKDGEKVSHQLVASYLKKLTDAGIKVLVIPGNHDINNPDAKSFDGASSASVASIAQNEFSSIYSDYGYKSAIATDATSLSYVSEPFPGFRVLALDACEYYNNTSTKCVTAGTLKTSTIKWALQQIADAKAKGKVIIGMMHHGIVPHYSSQTTFFPEYVVDNWKDASAELAHAGLTVMCTGHYHAQDISMTGAVGGEFLYDVETGSTVTYPSPYRIMTLKNGSMNISTRLISKIESASLQGQQFPEFSKAFITKGLDGLATYMLTSPPYSMSTTTASAVAPTIRNAFIAHYSGDEQLSATEKATIDQIVAAAGSYGPTLNALVMGLWTDTTPADKNITIDIKTGKVTQ